MTLMETEESLRPAQAMLSQTWWLLFPCFTVLTVRLVEERSCGDPYDLLPRLAADPRWAWPLAAIYLLAHLWMLAAYLLTVKGTSALMPTMREVRTLWGAETTKLLVMGSILLLEYSPVPLSRMIGSVLRCR